jgi:hypothetical protein
MNKIKRYIYIEARNIDEQVPKVSFWYTRVAATSEEHAYSKGAKVAGKRDSIEGTFLNDYVIPVREPKDETIDVLDVRS